MNDYVATAAAEKRLREVLTDRFPHHTEQLVEELAATLLFGAKIEYKARAKQVTITLDLPETATARKPKAADGDTIDSGPAFSPDDAADTDGTPNTPAPPTPHIAPFAPVLDADREYEDVHYD
jgi:hypothetical protein